MEIWEQQCEAALRIRDDFGWWKAAGYLVDGLDFHLYYFRMVGDDGTPERRPLKQPPALCPQSTMSQPHVRLLSDTSAIISYIRLIQRQANGIPSTSSFQETRVWQIVDGELRNVHLHRSKVGEDAPPASSQTQA